MDDYIGSYQEAPSPDTLDDTPADQNTGSWADAFDMPTPAYKDRKLLKLGTTLAKALPAPAHTAASQPAPEQPDADPSSTPDPDDQIQQLQKLTLPPVNAFGPGWVMNNIAQTLDRCMEIKPVYHRRQNRGRPPQPTGTYKFDTTGSLKALDLLARSLGMFTERLEIKGTLKTTSIEDLDNRIRALVTAHPSLRQLAALSPTED